MISSSLCYSDILSDKFWSIFPRAQNVAIKPIPTRGRGGAGISSIAVTLLVPIINALGRHSTPKAAIRRERGAEIEPPPENPGGSRHFRYKVPRPVPEVFLLFLVGFQQ